jgi:hypothetical protein
MEQYWSSITLNSIRPLLNEMGVLRNCLDLYWSIANPTFVLDKSANYNLEIGRSKKRLNSYEILKHPYLEGAAANCASYNYLANIQSHSLRKRILEILKLIDNEIN